MANRSPSTRRVALGVADARAPFVDLNYAPVWSMTTADALASGVLHVDQAQFYRRE